MSEATIASFILRFTQEYTPGSKPTDDAWRGLIRHVQTNEEIHFTRMENALGFIGLYVDIKNSNVRENEQDG